MGEPNESRFEALVSRLDRLEHQNRAQRRLITGATVAFLVLGSTTLYAQGWMVPPGFHVFGPDTPALASEVNTNFRWLLENPGAAFLTTGTCPSGYTAHQGGQYLRLGVPSLTPIARTLVTPAHRHEDLTGVTVSTGGAHTHTYNDWYWHDSQDTDDYGTPNGDDSGHRPDAIRTTQSAGNHSHTLSGRVGPSTGANGDGNLAITGELQHITLRLCVRT